MKPKRRGSTLKCGGVSPDLVARDFLAAESGPGSTLGEQVTSPTFYKIKTLATIVVKIINPTAAPDNSEALKKEKNYIIESLLLHKNHL